jgi:hypothetical protein
MLMNLFYGSGYFIFSGISNLGDLAVVIDNWQPGWLWRVGMTLLGFLLFMFCVWLALQELARQIGGEERERARRANKLCVLSYVTSVGVVLVAGLFHPYGFLSLPVTAGLMAVAGALSPLIWMMRWFQAKMYIKRDTQPLEIERKWSWVASAVVVVAIYALVLGRTLYF